MNIETKYNIGDIVYTIEGPSMRGGGHGWMCLKSEVLHFEIFVNEKGFDIKYTFRGKAESRYEDNIYTSREECDEKIDRIIEKL